MPVYVYAIITGLTSLLFFLTGLFVYSRNTRRPLYQRCFIFSTSVSLWALGYFITLLEIPNYSLNITASRLSHAFGAFIPITYLHFVWVILKRESKRKLFFGFYLFSGFMFCMSLTPLVVKMLLPKMGIQYYPEWGILYPVYSSLFLIFPGYAQYEMARQILRLKGTERTRLVYFFVALGLAFSGGVSLFLLIFNVPFPPYLSVLIILYPPMMAYTILVHKFMDIEVIFRKTLVFAGLSSFVFGVFAFVTFILREVLSTYTAVGNILASLLSVILIVLGYDPLRSLLVNITDRYLFQKRFKLSTIVAQASYAIALVRSLKWLSRRIVAFLVTKCRIKNAVVYIWDEHNQHFTRGAMRGYSREEFPPTILYENDSVIRHLTKSRRPLEVQSLEGETLQKRNTHDLKGDLQTLFDFLKASKAEVIIPSFLRRRIEAMGVGKESENQGEEEIVLRNILILGGKKSDESYSDEDLDVFYSLAQESAIAVENARLFDEAVSRKRELEEINRELEGTNRQLRVTQAQLIVAEKTATMVGMAKAIGHEVNNPLATVAARATLIYKEELKELETIYQNGIKTLLPEDLGAKIEQKFGKIRDNAERIDRSAKRIEVAVRTLTNILKDTKGELGPLNFRVLWRECLEASRFSTYDENLSGCDFKDNIAANLIIHGNAEQLIQVFTNLIKNSYEAMAGVKERRISIAADVDPEDPHKARIEFSDNGPGIDPSVQHKIWMQGFSTKPKPQGGDLGAAGQGQGLYVSKHIIESVHKGTISLQSEAGKGAAFIIQLPLSEEKADE